MVIGFGCVDGDENCTKLESKSHYFRLDSAVGSEKLASPPTSAYPMKRSHGAALRR